MNGRTFGHRRYVMLGYVALTLLVAGCSDAPGLDAVTGLFSSDRDQGVTALTASVGEPALKRSIKFTVGDRYTFDNPVERWEVVAVRGEKVYWRSDFGERQVTGFNPLLPPQEWSSRKLGKGRRLIRDKEGALFPMKVGATMKFRSTVTTDRPPFGWEHNWACEVTGKEMVKTLGGPFDTFVVACGHKRQKVVTYHYAPKVGNYLVRRVKSPDDDLDTVRNMLSLERADGTFVAGIGADRSVTTPKIAARRNAAASQPVSPSITTDVTVRDAVASLTLSEPNFGRRATSPTTMQTSGVKTSPTVSLTSVAQAIRQPTKNRKAVAKPTGPKLEYARKYVAVPRTPVVVPRVAAADKNIAARARVPVPAVRAKPMPETGRVPPPPVSVKAAPTQPRHLAALATATALPRTPVGGSIYLASYRSEAAAKQGWLAFKDKHGDLLNELGPEFRKVDVTGKGAYYSLYAGPLSADLIAGLCRKLNRRGVFCAPAS